MAKYHGFLTVTEAAAQAKMSRRTVASWADRYPGLAIYVAGMWRIHADQFQKILDGERQTRRGRPS